MQQQPMLETSRLILRPFAITDAPVVQRLAGVREVAKTTLSLPFPYEDGMAEAWISRHMEGYAKGQFTTFAVVQRDDNAMCGGMGLVLEAEHNRAEMGYWFGVPYWGRGYATEAGHAVLRYGFETLGLNRIFAMHFKQNPASGRVMQKLGMNYEGSQRQHIFKWGEYIDVELYGILESDWRTAPTR
jgi:RimJ/RimL family protein N-acetyltransferase